MQYFNCSLYHLVQAQIIVIILIIPGHPSSVIAQKGDVIFTLQGETGNQTAKIALVHQHISNLVGMSEPLNKGVNNIKFRMKLNVGVSIFKPLNSFHIPFHCLRTQILLTFCHQDQIARIHCWSSQGKPPRRSLVVIASTNITNSRLKHLNSSLL